MTFTQKQIDGFKKSFGKIFNSFDENFMCTDLSTYEEFDKCWDIFNDFRLECVKEIKKQEAKLNSLKGQRTTTHKPATRRPARK